MRGITRDSLVEFIDRKMIWIFAVVVAINLLVVVLTGNMETRFQFDLSGDMDVRDLNEMMGNPILRGFSGFMSVMVFLAVMATAGLIPKMLEKGRAEFYLSKPLSHHSLLLNKLFGIWTVYSGALLVGGLLVYGSLVLVHGVSDVSIVVLLLFSLVSLFIWISIIGFIGVLSGSTAAAIMTAFLLWVVEKILGYREVFKELLDSRLADGVIDALYYFFPKTSATSDIFYTIAAGSTVDNWIPLWTTILFALAMLLGSIWLIRRKDF